MNGLSLNNLSILDMGAGAVLCAGLIVLSVIDWRTFRLPNMYTLPLLTAGLIYQLIAGDIFPAALGAALGYLVFVALELGYKKIRGRDGLGRGDAKLLAAGGAWCGAFALPFIVLIASASALAALMLPSVRARGDRGHLPFGPFLSFGIFITWLALSLSGY